MIATIELTAIDWTILIGFFAVSLGIGASFTRRSGTDSNQFFLSGRNMPWWLLGFSMVATTFSTDTPNLVTDIVRNHGVAGNWVWFAFLLTGMLTVFLYARLWRRSEVFTDVEFYELRYSGKAGAFLRGFRSLYLGVIYNVSIMSGVTLAAIKIGSVMFNWTPVESVVIAILVTTIFSVLGGFRGVIIMDLILFVFAMVGAFAAAWFALGHPNVGGLDGLFQNDSISQKLQMIPVGSDWSMNLIIGIFLFPLLIQWWAAWYPGAEPGGGGYLAQRMLAAKDETNALGSVLFFQFCHYALRPWPWIIVALASLVVYPDIASLKEAFPHVPDSKLGEDLGYSAMLTHVPPFWMGIIVTSLAAAYMSTISTHLNWGSSYIVNDFWKRFIERNASESKLVLVGRVTTLVLAILTALFALSLQNALQIFDWLIKIGAGTGLLFILRWFWWRINAWSEITSMIVSFLSASVISLLSRHLPAWGYSQELADNLGSWPGTLLVIGLTTIAWIIATLFAPQTDRNTLRNFLAATNPGGPGWKRIEEEAIAKGHPIQYKHEPINLPAGLLAMALGSLVVYGALFSAGFFLYGYRLPGSFLAVTAILASVGIYRLWPKLTDSRNQ
ncbi:MAG: sodium:solute symporter family protein [Puniceicoccaceae bacterium]